MRDLRPPLRQAEPENRFKWTHFFFSGLALFVGGGLAASVLSVVLYAWIPVPVTPLMVFKSIEAGFAGEKMVYEKDWVSLEKIQPQVIRAAIASEDFRFIQHAGFDFEAIRKAIETNKRAERNGRKRVRGASTISQQTAKNVFLWPSRSWVRKGVEAWFTILMESVWSKRRIMEVYLNVIEFGPGVYGVEAASRHYFKKPAARLTSAEAALLIAVLPNPIRFRVDRPSAYVRYRQSAILRRMPYVEMPD
ncbi:MAG: monofunctional biosynthetic peptidoglycan transglycosylase [Bdellovibrionales bacterium]|nr:monofunctional biosynthetic peptidoglycan transglycosylase [Bdellovibrionales bacterium]